MPKKNAYIKFIHTTDDSISEGDLPLPFTNNSTTRLIEN